MGSKKCWKSLSDPPFWLLVVSGNDFITLRGSACQGIVGLVILVSFCMNILPDKFPLIKTFVRRTNPNWTKFQVLFCDRKELPQHQAEEEILPEVIEVSIWLYFLLRFLPILFNWISQERLIKLKVSAQPEQERLANGTTVEEVWFGFYSVNTNSITMRAVQSQIVLTICI